MICAVCEGVRGRDIERQGDRETEIERKNRERQKEIEKERMSVRMCMNVQVVLIWHTRCH